MSNIEMQSVSSSNVDSVGYDADNLTLRVQFHGGGVYDYIGVSQAQFDALVSSPSVGQYLNMVIKPQFEYVQVV